MTEYEKCKKLIELNGGNKIETEENNYIHYDFHGYGIDINNDEIVFLGDNGDFASIKTGYYELLGCLIHYNMLGVGFKRLGVSIKPKAETIKEMDKSISCLALEIPGEIYEDVLKKWKSVKESINV
jgi:hypothetical protein